jgi:adenosylmethionine-8-amino-7-oxononanoate aminotransferase
MSVVQEEVQQSLLCKGDKAGDAYGDTTHLNTTNGTFESGILHARMNDQPPKAVSSKGCWITTADGLEIFDASSGAAVACIGHNDPRVSSAIMRQLNDIAYCYAPFFTSEPAEKLARVLSESTAHQLPKAFIVSSGKSVCSPISKQVSISYRSILQARNRSKQL